MLAYAIRRILLMIPILLGLLAFTFLLTDTNPGGEAVIFYIRNPKYISASDYHHAEVVLGLDKPLPIRFALYAKTLLTGNLGYSLRQHVPVGGIIESRLGPTLILLGSAFLLQEIIAIPLGIFVALKRGSPFDQVASVVVYVLYAVPTFWIGLMAIVLIGVDLRWLPFPGMVDLSQAGGDFGTPQYTQYFQTHVFAALGDLARHLVMPLIVLAITGIAGDTRYLRGQMLEVLDQDYIRTARAKGLPYRLVIWKHALRNAILPIVTSIGLQLPGLVGGAIVTEQIFGWPGMGSLYVTAANTFDYPVIIGITLLIGLLTLISNLLIDLSYAWIDPRIRYS
jgi:peptide/nickel transport system permease protein